MTTHEHLSNPEFEQFTPDEAEDVLHFDSVINSEDPSVSTGMVAGSLEAWHALPEDDPHKTSLASFVCAAEAMGAAATARESDDAFAVVRATGKLNEDDADMFRRTATKFLKGINEGAGGTVAEHSADIVTILSGYRERMRGADSDYSAEEPADNVELALTALAAGQLGNEPGIQEQWRARLKSAVESRAPIADSGEGDAEAIEPAGPAEAAEVGLTIYDQAKQQLEENHPGSGPIFETAIGALDRVSKHGGFSLLHVAEPYEYRQTQLAGMTQLERNTAEIVADGTAIVGGRRAGTLPTDLVKTLYNMTGSELVYSDAEEGNDMILKVFRGQHDGEPVYFLERRWSADNNKKTPDMTRIYVADERFAKAAMNALTDSDYAQVAKAAGVERQQAASIVRELGLDKNSLPGALRALQAGRRAR